MEIMDKSLILQIRNAAPQDFGGGERYPILLAKELSLLGINIVVLSGSDRLIKFAKQNGVSVKKSWWWKNQSWSGARALLFPAYLLWQTVLFFYYLTIFVRLKPSVIHIQSKDDFIGATLAGKFLGKRVVWTDHADLKHVLKNITKWYKNPTGHLVYFASRFADNITVVSKSELHEINKSLPKSNVLKNKIRVVYNGSPDHKASHAPVKNHHFTFLIASRLVQDKGVGEAIKAFNSLNKKHPDTKLVILGDGPDQDDFKKQAQANKNIVFLGHQESPLSLMASCDVFLLPTYHEGFSVALVEAAMLGLPVITTGVGGNVEIIKDGHNGLLVPAKNVKELQKAMEKLYLDQKLNKRLGVNNRDRYLNNYIFSDIVKKYILPIYGTGKKGLKK